MNLYKYLSDNRSKGGTVYSTSENPLVARTLSIAVEGEEATFVSATLCKLLYDDPYGDIVFPAIMLLVIEKRKIRKIRENEKP